MQLQNSIRFKKEDFTISRTDEFLEFYSYDPEKDFIQEGNKSRIYKCVHQETGEIRAVKILTKSRRNDEDRELYQHEFKMMKKLDHPNVVWVYEMFETDQCLYLVMEFCKGGELYDAIGTGDEFMEGGTAVLMMKLLDTVKYMHDQSIVHLALKPSNILIESLNVIPLQPKIIDFGGAIITKEAIQRDGLFGSAAYMAPEALEEEMYGPKNDIWACGVIAYQILAGFLPFSGCNDMETLEQIQYTNVSFNDPVWMEGVSSQGIDFVRSLLNRDPEKRPTAEEALQHPWIQKIRMHGMAAFERDRSAVATRALENIKKFRVQSKLKQATIALIISQLIMSKEKKHLDDVFSAMDSNRSGTLSKNDIQAGFKKYLHVDLTRSQTNALFKNCDLNNNGVLEYSEFIVAAMSEKNLLKNDKLRKAFDIFDTDGTGYITAGNLTQALKFFITGDATIEEYVTEKFMKQLNKRKDEQISYEDFLEVMFDSTVDDANNEPVLNTRNLHVHSLMNKIDVRSLKRHSGGFSVANTMCKFEKPIRRTTSDRGPRGPVRSNRRRIGLDSSLQRHLSKAPP